jgi:hypothetical protein
MKKVEGCGLPAAETAQAARSGSGPRRRKPEKRKVCLSRFLFVS